MASAQTDPPDISDQDSLVVEEQDEELLNSKNQQLYEPQLLRPMIHAVHMIRYIRKFLDIHGQKLSRMQEQLIFSYHARPKINSKKDNIKCLTATGLIGNIIAQGRTPSLVIDAQMLTSNSFIVISDRSAIIYSLLPNVRHQHFFPDYKNLMNKIKEYPFDVSIYTGLVFQNKQELDKEEEEYFKSKESDQFMFNMQVSGIVPRNSDLSFIIPSTFGKSTLFGGIDGQFTSQLRKLYKEMHKPTNEIAAFATLAHDLMAETAEWVGQSKISFSDSVSLIHKSYGNLQYDEKSTKLSDEDNKIRFPDSLPKKINNWRHNTLMISQCTITDYNILQSLPEVKPFVLLSHRGWCACAVPVRYDQIPFRDIEMRISSAASLISFGQSWINQQAQLFQDYDIFERNSFHSYIQMEIEEELEETGTLMMIPFHPVMRYHTPVYPIRFGRYFDTQMLYGISPNPLQAENLRWRTFEPWQLRKVISLMGAEGDVRQRWKLSEREKVRTQLNLPRPPDEEKAKQQIAIFRQQQIEEQKKKIILMFKKFGKEEDEKKEKNKQLLVDENDKEIASASTSTIQSKSNAQQSMNPYKSNINSMQLYIFPEVTGGHTELTIHQPTMSFLQEYMHPQYRRKNSVLLTLTGDALEHPIPLNNTQRSVLQNRIISLPKEFY
ncbi:MAG: hypothetical protein EZS28_011450 [Streblomastix strix]|uniref:Uncharacterized protein n=1 Tax=Streblomastix strix TaxID=222440 RepID=A0A5J4WDK2_9EUKA|nr:MAG: hypothetical protein EZS28_011450 [Streblomastix strix]